MVGPAHRPLSNLLNDINYYSRPSRSASPSPFIILYNFQKMNSEAPCKKKIEIKKKLKRTSSSLPARKADKKKSVLHTASSASLSKNTGSTAFTSKSLPKKATHQKLVKSKKTGKNKENQPPKSKFKSKNSKSRKEKVEELTDRKKIHLEYFMYKNVCLPIENTEQRKFVYKIHLVDERCLSSRNKSTATDSPPKQSTACSPIQFQLPEKECQTEELQRESEMESVFSSEPEKNFIATLSELQFLYLPDQKNFEGFSPSEQIHYKELFTYFAKKFTNNRESLDEAAIEAMLTERECVQRGVMECSLKEGIPTHVPSILSYLANFFCFIDIHEKAPLVDRINCNYGYSMREKLCRLRHSLTTRRPSKLISESTFWAFEEELHGQMNFDSAEIEEYLHFHNKAIFDCVNECLEFFQPYYSSSGEPFPWNYSFQTTFYCITEDSFGALGSQIKEKVWQSCMMLAGLLLDVDCEQKYKTHIQKILLNERTMMNKEIKKIDDRVQVEESQTKLLMDVADLVEAELLAELQFWLQG